MTALRRLFGAALLVGAYVPLHRLLDPARTGPAGLSTRDAAETAWSLGVSGTLIVVVFAWVCARMTAESRRGGVIRERWTAYLSRPRPAVFALLTGVSAFVLASTIAAVVHGAVPTSVDEMAQLLHARALAAGRLGIPLDGSPAAWIIQNGIETVRGWASIYPPGHTLALAAGVLVGAPWLVGPLATGLATGCVTWSAERLLGSVPGRCAGLLLLLSPYWLLLGATELSHTTAMAAIAAVLAAAIAAREGQARWAVGTGAAIGLAVTARPWVGLVASISILVTLWGPIALRNRAWAARTGAALVVGGLPFAWLLFGWNRALFGSSTRLGYSAAFGPAHGLGLHTDPWGNAYGALEAVAYTGADLAQLGVRLFESPLPSIALIGFVLLLRPLPRGSGAFLAWAGSAVAANALYWHHGIHFGPRMLVESTPAWSALFVAAASVAFRAGSGERASYFGRWVVGTAIVGGAAFAPFTVLAARNRDPVATPRPPEASAVVFVHGAWASRISARLAAVGMRRDSIETALRRNDICLVDRYARWRSAGAIAPAPPLDVHPRPGTPTNLVVRTLSPGNRVRIAPEVQPDPACIREARSDRFGVLDLELLLWRAPPLPDVRTVVARDLGPAGNLPLVESMRGAAWVYVDSGGQQMLLDYAAGMELLWGGAAGRTVR